MTYIHSHGNGNHTQIELEQPSILGKTVRNKPRMHKMNKVKVQSSINKQKDDLFDSIPDFVDVDPGLVNL